MDGVTLEKEKRSKVRKRTTKNKRIRPPQPFHYENPERDSGKTIVSLGQTDVVRGLVQIVKPGEGDNNLHIHTGMDSIWFVLKGRVRFYGEGDKVIGEYGGRKVVVPNSPNLVFVISETIPKVCILPIFP